MSYKIKKTKKLIKKLQKYWKEYCRLDNDFRKNMHELEQRMEKETGIKGIELFWCDNECVGIGNEMRTMELIKMEELEEGKIINYD
jgi:hypothetical protein